MPWSPKDAYRHTHKAKSDKAERQWSDVANSELKRGLPEGRAIQAANAVVGRRGHAAGGSLSPLESVVGDPMHMRSTLPKLGGNPAGIAGRLRMPRVPIADAMRNIDQSMHGARVKLPQLKARLGYPDGGPVERPRGSSSPGTPGVGGAVHDALSALRDYLLGSTQRENAAARQAREDAVINGPGGPARPNDPTTEYAGGGKVRFSPKAHGALKAALSHLANKDHSSAAAALRASPEAMSHPVVQQAAHSLRSSAGLGPATQAIANLAQQSAPATQGAADPTQAPPTM
jgi:hypothetical protein